LVFSALPESWFVDVWKFEMYWGCPAPVFIVGSPDFSHHFYSMWWQRYYIVLLAREFLREPYWARIAARALRQKDSLPTPVQYGRAG
jgi:hypothetical protein